MTRRYVRHWLLKKSLTPHTANTWIDSTNSTNRQGCIGMGEAGRTKVCLICGVTYTPVQHQYERQLYCSQTCKHRMRWMKRKENGLYSGGYSRHIYIRLWLLAMGIELHTASCHYCGTELEPDKPFNIDHKTPRSIIRDNKKLKNDIDNMVIACPTCNGLKGSTEYEEFKARMEVNK